MLYFWEVWIPLNLITIMDPNSKPTSLTLQPGVPWISGAYLNLIMEEVIKAAEAVIMQAVRILSNNKDYASKTKLLKKHNKDHLTSEEQLLSQPLLTSLISNKILIARFPILPHCSSIPTPDSSNSRIQDLSLKLSLELRQTKTMSSRKVLLTTLTLQMYCTMTILKLKKKTKIIFDQVLSSSMIFFYSYFSR